MNLRKTPPHTLNVCRCHGPIRFIKINPESHAISHGSKCVYVTCDRFAALVIELRDTKLFNIAFTVKAQLFFNCNFNRKSVTIPTSFTNYLLAFHCMKTRKDILKNSSFNVVCTWHAICSRGTFIESPCRCALSARNRFFKDLLSAPKIKNRVLHCWKIDLGRYRAKGHKKGSLFHAHA